MNSKLLNDIENGYKRDFKNVLYKATVFVKIKHLQVLIDVFIK